MPVVPLKSSPDLVLAKVCEIRRVAVASRPGRLAARVARAFRTRVRQGIRMRAITVLSGGMGGAKFLQGLLHGIEHGLLPGVDTDAEVTVIANTADDLWVHGLKVCPDLDTVMYTLGDGIDLERGWGRREETWSAKDELAAYGVEPTWFGLGDRDIATHLVRTQMLDAGFPLSEVTTALCRRWLAPLLGDRVRLLPMSDDRVETHVAIADADSPSGRKVVHFQEYWVRLRAEVPAEALVFVGLDAATPGPGVIDAITDADLVIVPPSNPVVSVGTILGVDRVRAAVASTKAPVIGLSPIIGGTHVRGMAHQMLTSIGVEVSAGAVALHYGSRRTDPEPGREQGILDAWLVDEVDADQVSTVEAAGIACRAVPLLMTSPAATAAMAATAIGLVT
jgi:LPPG:FO 2-phospho-L-lactate transferase